MKDKTYIPRPADTKDVLLSDELMGLTEEMARNVHDVWSAGRIADGWTWGPVRDDAKKEHPCLVPYEELQESEKEYDRNTAIETLKLILSLGYRIEKS
ncbi:MAG: Ryanodine receptor Ryr [Prevotella sp.]|nr:Ryanodine receptor Ryr [Prevotella sp.]